MQIWCLFKDYTRYPGLCRRFHLTAYIIVAIFWQYYLSERSKNFYNIGSRFDYLTSRRYPYNKTMTELVPFHESPFRPFHFRLQKIGHFIFGITNFQRFNFRPKNCPFNFRTKNFSTIFCFYACTYFLDIRKAYKNNCQTLF
jgi:hypothetical protein